MNALAVAFDLKVQVKMIKSWKIVKSNANALGIKAKSEQRVTPKAKRRT